MFLYGKTKVYMRTVFFDELENTYNKILSDYLEEKREI